MDAQEVGWGLMDWIDLAQERDRWGSFECGNGPSSFIKCGTFINQIRTHKLFKQNCAPWSE